VARTTPYNHQVGDSVQFSVLDLSSVEAYAVTASVRSVTDHAYFFVQEGSSVSDGALDQITSDFESLVWPTITGAFGEPLTPGVDGDPRITILHADLRGAGAYVRGADGFPSAVMPNSNEREMIYVEHGVLSAPGTTYNSLLGHELQHLVHQNQDKSEEAWINEGMSQVALEMAGGSTDAVWEFLGRPDTQLNFWPYQSGVSIHYAASELFLGYLLDQYGGRENGKALASIESNGIDGVEEYVTGFGKTFDDVFADFVAANVLDNADGPYAHPGFNGNTTAISEASGSGEESVSQFGTDYYQVEPGVTFRIDGTEAVTVGVPEIGGPFWWSNRSDGMDSRLTRTIDLTGVTSATLSFDAWYDIEPGWDYAYVAASTDAGRTWQALAGQQTTTYDPIGAAYGPGYTRTSGGWVGETIDLSAYAGDEILLRFEYITDDATHLTGFAVDNIAIDAIGLTDGADSLHGWIIEGFRRIDGPLEQSFIVQVISDGASQRISLDGSNAAAIAIDRPSVIAISGATRLTTEAARYAWSVE
jgi:immune inhibitor A